MVSGRARYLSVAEAPHNTEFYEWMGKKHFCSFQTAETDKRAPNSRKVAVLITALGPPPSFDNGALTFPETDTLTFALVMCVFTDSLDKTGKQPGQRPQSLGNITIPLYWLLLTLAMLKMNLPGFKHVLDDRNITKSDETVFNICLLNSIIQY